MLSRLAERRRFGMKPGLETIARVCAALGNPQRRLRGVIHVAGTNGKGAVCAILDAALGGVGNLVGRYTSPHLVKLNERFFLGGQPIDDVMLERASRMVEEVCEHDLEIAEALTFFEALTAVAFELYVEANPDWVVLETGLGGRLDATNICLPRLCVITRIGLDHCDWLGDTVEKIAAEKAGIIKPGVPIVLGCNEPSVVEVIRTVAESRGAPFVYAPDIADESEIPEGFALAGGFNRENAVTAIAALKALEVGVISDCAAAFSNVIWPGRFQRIGNYLVDGAHNPPAATALAASLGEDRVNLIAGFCGDKDVDAVLRILSPHVAHGYAVQTNNPRSLSAVQTAAKMRRAGFDAEACDSLDAALALTTGNSQLTLVCGSLFLAGEAVVRLGAYPWIYSEGFDPSEQLLASKPAR